MKDRDRDRVIIITRRNPLTEFGGDIRRIEQYINFYLEKNVAIDLVCFGSKKFIIENHLLTIHQIDFSWFSCIHLAIKALLTRTSIQRKIFLQPKFIKKIKNLTSCFKYKHGIIHLSRFAEYSKEAPWIDWVLEMTDAVSMNYQREIENPQYSFGFFIRKRENFYLKLEEKLDLTNFNKIVVISEIDKEYLEKNGSSKTKISVIPNAFNSKVPIKDYVKNTSESISIGFIGKFSYFPNQRALHYILEKIVPEFEKQGIKTNLTLIGSSLNKKIKKKISAKKFIFIENPKSIPHEITKIDVNLCPMFSCSGIQNKIIDAISAGIPTVASSISAKPFYRISHEFRKVIFETNTEDPNEFVSQALKVRELHIKKESFSICLEMLSWNKVCSDINSIFNEPTSAPQYERKPIDLAGLETTTEPG
jgi:glycosyltransferase involved in cell wall biosynthesis